MVVALVATATNLAAAAPKNKVAPDLQKLIQKPPAGLISLIVQTEKPVGQADQDRVRQLGGRWKKSWTVIRAYAAELPAPAVNALAALADVRCISLDRTARMSMDTTTKAVGADIARSTYGATGLNIGVAVLDTGIQVGPEFGTVRGWADLVNGQGSPYDDNGHGTHVAGVVAGTGQATVDAASSVRYQGLAPRASLVAVKVLGQDGSGSVSTIISGVQWCVSNRGAYNLRVLNLSLGYIPGEGYTTDPLCQAVEAAVQAGIVVCAAAGNFGKDPNGSIQYGGILSPGIDPWVLTVGATNTQGTPVRSDDSVSSYSSRGPTYLDGLAKPDLVAPGNRIISVRAVNSYLDTSYPANRLARGAYSPGASGDSPYFIMSGTSMATPVVAGAVALICERNAGLSPNAIKAILMYSAQRMSLSLSSGLSTLTQGAGNLNVLAALEIATKINPSAPPGALWLTGSLSFSTAIQGQSIPWTRSILWGNNVAGGDTIHYRQFAWGGNVAWGEGGTWASNVAWGENAVTSDPSWQNAAAWGNALAWATGSPTINTIVRGE
jgi:serine protease AprX